MIQEWSSDYFQHQQQQQQQQTSLSLSDGGSSSSSSSGFNLTVCEVAGMAAAALKGLLGGASSSLDGAVDGCVVVTWSARQLSNIIVSPAASSPSSLHAGDEMEQKFRACVLNLRPNTAYMTRCVID